jgi:hypothetical protein
MNKIVTINKVPMMDLMKKKKQKKRVNLKERKQKVMVNQLLQVKNQNVNNNDCYI